MINQIKQISTITLQISSVVSAVAFFDYLIITGDTKGIITIWESDGKQYKSIKVIVGHMHCVDCITVINAEQRLIATGSQGQTTSIRIWNIDDGVCMTTFKGHKNTISSIVAFDHLLASSSYDGTIKIWNLKTKQIQDDVDAHGYPVLCLIKSQDNKTLISGGDDCKIKVWETQTWKMTCEGISSKGYVQSLCWLQDNTFASGISNGDILIWSLKSLRQCIKVLSIHSEPVTGMANLNGKLISVSEDRKMYVWQSIEQNRFYQIKKPHKNLVSGIAVNNKQNLVVTGGKQGVVKVWKASQ